MVLVLVVPLLCRVFYSLENRSHKGGLDRFHLEQQTGPPRRPKEIKREEKEDLVGRDINILLNSSFWFATLSEYAFNTFFCFFAFVF